MVYFYCVSQLYFGDSLIPRPFFYVGRLNMFLRVFFFFFFAAIWLHNCWSPFYLHVITDGPAGKLVGHPWLVKACVQHNCWPPVRMSGGSRFPPCYFFPSVVVELGNPEV